MMSFKVALAAVTLAAPLFLGVAPAEALTSNQYAAQGYGHYIPSKGRAPHYRGYGYGYRPYGYGYRPYGWRRHYGY